MQNNQPQILILHGWGHNKQVWQPVVERLQNDFGDVRAIDLPGFGEEPLPDKSWGVPEYINWVNEYIESQRFANLILVGHSFGGRITSGIAAQQPDNLIATVLIGAPSIYRPSRRTKRRIFIKRFLNYSYHLT